MKELAWEVIDAFSINDTCTEEYSTYVVFAQLSSKIKYVVSMAPGDYNWRPLTPY